jgi:hypothetical protein
VGGDELARFHLVLQESQEKPARTKIAATSISYRAPERPSVAQPGQQLVRIALSEAKNRRRKQDVGLAISGWHGSPATQGPLLGRAGRLLPLVEA